MVESMKNIIDKEVRELNNKLDFNRVFYDSLSEALNDPDVTEKFTAVKAHAEAYTTLMNRMCDPKRIRFDIHFSSKHDKFVCICCN